jgi:hypothetical protein
MSIADISHALGSGVGTAIIWFPITYVAMRKQFKLKTLTKLWRPFWGCVVTFSILLYLFGQPPIDSFESAIMFMMLPIFVSASVLYWTSRETVSKQPVRQESKSHLTEDADATAIAIATQDTAQPISVNSPKEMIAFRFLMLAWGMGLLALIISGASHLVAEQKQMKISAIAAVSGACINKVMKATHDCQIPYTESDGTCSRLANQCNSDPSFDQLVSERDDSRELVILLLYVALWLLTLPSLAFYAIRWAITGRLKPLWLLDR